MMGSPRRGNVPRHPREHASRDGSRASAQTETKAAAARLFQDFLASAVASRAERGRLRGPEETVVCNPFVVSVLGDTGSACDYIGRQDPIHLANCALKYTAAALLIEGAASYAPNSSLRRQQAERERWVCELFADTAEACISGSPCHHPAAAAGGSSDGIPSVDLDDDSFLARELHESLRLKKERKGFISRLGEARSVLKDRDWKETNIMCAVTTDEKDAFQERVSGPNKTSPNSRLHSSHLRHITRDAETQTDPAIESSAFRRTLEATKGKQLVEILNDETYENGGEQLPNPPSTFPSANSRWNLGVGITVGQPNGSATKLAHTSFQQQRHSVHPQWTSGGIDHVSREPGFPVRAETVNRYANGGLSNGFYPYASPDRKRITFTDSTFPEENLPSRYPELNGDSFMTAKQHLAKEAAVGGDRSHQYPGGNAQALRQMTIPQYRVAGCPPGSKRRLVGKFVSPVPMQKEVPDDAEPDDEKPPAVVLRARGGLTKRSRSRSDFICPLTKQREVSRQPADGCGTGPQRSIEPEVADERLRNVEAAMVEKIKNEIMHSKVDVSWDDIAGLQEAKDTIKEIVVWPLLRPDIFTGLRGPPKGLLLFGPPGTGKTLIGKCIASQSNATFFSISSSSLTSKWLGDAEKMVRALFSVARCYQPAVIFVDEIDSLLSSRTEGEVEASRRIKTEFLIQFDGCGTTTEEDRILVVGATNRPQEIDEAARRRFRKRIYIPLPEARGRRGIIQNLLAKQQHSLTDQEIDDIVEKTLGYSGSDVDGLCREAALGPIRCIGDIRNISVDEVRPVNYCDFISALKQIRASVSDKDLDLYRSWNREYGSGTLT